MVESSLLCHVPLVNQLSPQFCQRRYYGAIVGGLLCHLLYLADDRLWPGVSNPHGDHFPGAA